MKTQQIHELILQSLEHELGGVEVYETAVTCAVNADLKGEWQKYLDQTKKHVSRLEAVCDDLGIDSKLETPGRAVVRHTGRALVEAMKLARENAGSSAAQIVACECITLAETKDHLDWELLGKCVKHLGAKGKALKEAVDATEDEEDEHLYHTKGWCRELWIQSLGMTAVLPPPEERKNVKTAIGAARAEQSAERHRATHHRA